MVIMMSIIKYFKHVATGTEPDEHKDERLPKLTGPLSKSVPMKAIELANTKVANVTHCNNRIRPYLILMPAQRYVVGKQASEHGITASINFTRGTVQALLVSFVKQLPYSRKY